ncbi:MAG: D-2-hydroxyacid dehydrogenase [Armatimonadota bacterium]
MPSPIRVLVGSSDPGFHTRVRSVSDRIELVTAEEARERPELLAAVEVAFGGLPPERHPEATALRWIQTQGAGVESFLTPTVRERGILLTNASGIHADPIAEHLFGMLLGHLRRLPQAWDHQRRSHWWEGPNGELGELRGKTLGILGMGAIGAQCARVGAAFGMRVIGLRRSGEPHPLAERIYAPAERAAFLSECDVLFNLLPISDSTRGFLGWGEFAALKPGAIVGNAGRGGTIDTEALVAALREGRVSAALLDVTDPEPLPADHPLWTMENVYVTPHYAGRQPEYEARAAEIFLENLRRYVAGEPLRNQVDPAAGY